MSTRRAGGPADDPAGAGDRDSATEDRAATEGRTATEDRTAPEDRTATEDKVCGWFADRIPNDWFTAAPDIQVDREEITIVGPLAAPDTPGGSDAERAAAAQGRIHRFREETRNRRMEIAREAEHRFRRKVSWGVTCADAGEMFTSLSVPVMTRLRQPERRVLDTLVDAGVARSRSDALAWCVRLTGENADAWLSRLRAALRHVEEVREEGPASG